MSTGNFSQPKLSRIYAIGMIDDCKLQMPPRAEDPPEPDDDGSDEFLENEEQEAGGNWRGILNGTHTQKIKN